MATKETSWEHFELECCTYLSNNYGQYATFKHCGNHNSTIPDILVITKTNKTFYIEAKKCPAQAGQFVLKPDLNLRKFILSNENTTPLNKFTYQIIEYMNSNFDQFKNPGTAGKKIEMINSSNIFSNWIKEKYKSENVKFFIINNYIIFPLDKLQDYVTVSATYRTKTSGSRSVPKYRYEEVSRYIKENYPSISDLYVNNNGIQITSSINLSGECFKVNDIRYKFSISKDTGKTKISCLGTTKNPNVIFSIKANNSLPNYSHLHFLNDIK